MGKYVINVKIGDYVLVEIYFVCGICVFCLIGKYYVCIYIKIFGVDIVGLFVEYVKVLV